MGLLDLSTDAQRLNVVVNDPDVRPWVGGDPSQPLDLSALVADTCNRFLLGEHGGFGYLWTGPRIYEVHTFILAAGRGQWARDAARESLAAMAPLADLIWTRVAPGARHVAAFARRAGFKVIGTRRFDLGGSATPYTLMEWRP